MVDQWDRWLVASLERCSVCQLVGMWGRRKDTLMALQMADCWVACLDAQMVDQRAVSMAEHLAPMKDAHLGDGLADLKANLMVVRWAAGLVDKKA